MLAPARHQREAARVQAPHHLAGGHPETQGRRGHVASNRRAAHRPVPETAGPKSGTPAQAPEGEHEDDHGADDPEEAEEPARRDESPEAGDRALEVVHVDPAAAVVAGAPQGVRAAVAAARDQEEAGHDGEVGLARTEEGEWKAGHEPAEEGVQGRRNDRCR